MPLRTAEETNGVSQSKIEMQCILNQQTSEIVSDKATASETKNDIKKKQSSCPRRTNIHMVWFLLTVTLITQKHIMSAQHSTCILVGLDTRRNVRPQKKMRTHIQKVSLPEHYLC